MILEEKKLSNKLRLHLLVKKFFLNWVMSDIWSSKDPPQSPRGIIAMNATAESVLLKWEPPLYVDEGRRYWYTLSYKTRYAIWFICDIH